jgi:hypothetical protein
MRVSAPFAWALNIFSVQGPAEKPGQNDPKVRSMQAYRSNVNLGLEEQDQPLDSHDDEPARLMPGTSGVLNQVQISS